MLKKDELLELEITSMTHEGMGVGKKDGFAVFVQGAIMGEKVLAKIIKAHKTYAIARIDKLITASPERAEPFCPVYRRCGGCSLQHMSYKETLAFKHRVVNDNITRIGGFTDIKVEPVLGMEEPYYYRNKAQYPIGMSGDRVIAGFFARRSHEIVDSSVCSIQDKVSDNAREAVLSFIKNNRISVYDETTGRGLIRHLVVKVGFNTGEVMVILVTASPSVPKLDRLVEILRSKIPNLKSVVLNINRQEGNVVMGNENKILYGSETITDKLGGMSFEISPLSFYQVNPVQTEVLYSKAIDFAGLSGEETVMDLYCGIGTIGLYSAGKVKQVIGVENVPEAVEAAKRNASLNGIDNAIFYCGDVETVVPELNKEGIKADVVFVDPPRKGCDEGLLKTLLDMKPEKIVYVSCNPSTLARDLKVLCGKVGKLEDSIGGSEDGKEDKGIEQEREEAAVDGCMGEYKVVKVQPVDMFPWTEHVEAVIMMTYCGSDKKTRG